jgi:uncharacterized protein YggE
MFVRTFVALSALFCIVSAVIAAEPGESLVHVTGHGLVRVAPDQVVIDLTVTTTDDDLIRVRASSDDDARKILTLAKKHGVADEGFDVERLQLKLDYSEQLRRQIYEVQRDITLTLGDLTKLDAMLSDLLAERSLKVVGINFGAGNMREHEFEALRRAVTDAKEKAAHLAQLNGLELGDAREIHVVREFQTPFATSVVPVVGAAKPRGLHRDAGVVEDVPKQTNVQFVAFQADDDAKKEGKQFALGMIEITAQVSIDFDLGE